ncbi:RNA 3'-terminal phosphate cyclase [Aquicella lusitana]|uniref:RNA 3'-terminal phosphate cyclase n=1 Tax=Aquicella lusitana TaxID=254246 RepID=A0A370GZI8_9COXI|nr:RNA 3'-terminal phosphate cyclase [Aquicella lusitana]RDI48727.1 RNA 3'-terminal phosphate cyclase (ATP) [Aquicella lusitana]VVC73155.1 RNA 3'-terminal phosphate cyclase [Aquicella lusitana]
MGKLITIDGSYGEGGGQMVRTSLTLSAITGQPFILKAVRSKRGKPGLLPQHMMACVAVNTISQGRLEGAALGSDAFRFEPGTIKGGTYHFDIGTAGSLILLAQAIIPICLHATDSSRICLTGGTHVLQSPGYDYFAQVFLPALQRFGANVQIRQYKTGYYPKGGGLLEFEIQPQVLQGCTNWSSSNETHAVIRLSRLAHHIAEREKQVLMQQGIEDIQLYEEAAFSPGNAVTLWQGFRGAYVLGKVGKKAEQVAEEAFLLLQQEEGEVDRYLSDQLLIYAALARGETRYITSEITGHLRTNAFVISKFVQRDIDFSDHCIRIR